MSNGNAPTLQSVYSCEENCRRTYTDWIAVSPETTETGVADLFYTVLFNGCSKIGIVGASTTGMLALLAASYYPQISLTIAISPPDFVMVGV